MLKEYDLIVPGSAARILDLAERQADHRMSLEQRVTTSDMRRSWGGLIAGFVCQLTAIGSGSTLAYLGQPVAGGTIATVSMAAVVYAFVYGTRSQRQERVEKTKLMVGRK